MKIPGVVKTIFLLAAAVIFTWRIPANVYSHGVNARTDVLVDVVFSVALVFVAVLNFKRNSQGRYGFGVQPEWAKKNFQPN